jgi:predicted porin
MKIWSLTPIATLIIASTLPSFANAQTSSPITLYGRVNVTFENVKVQDGISRNDVNDNASRFGIRGSEDLGGGLKAIFQLETAFRADQNNTAFANRPSYVGLSGGFGTVKLGRVFSSVYNATYDWVSLHNHDTGRSSDAFLYDAAISGVVLSNAVTYSTPTFGGVRVDLDYSIPNEIPRAIDGAKARHNSATVTFEQGPFYAALGTGQVRNAATFNKSSVVTGAFLFSTKVFTLGALVDKGKTDGVERKAYWRLVGMVPFGATELHVNYGKAGKIDGVNNSDAKQFTFGVNYNFTKRTKVYGFYTKIDNNSGANYAFLANTPVGKDNTSLAAGIRHNF